MALNNTTYFLYNQTMNDFLASQCPYNLSEFSYFSKFRVLSQFRVLKIQFPFECSFIPVLHPFYTCFKVKLT